MDFPRNITIQEGAFATDGGSIWLLISYPDNQKHNLVLSQHLLPPSGHPDEREPGRLYFDGKIIEIRSKDELSIISALKQAHIEPLVYKESSMNTNDTAQAGIVVGEDIKAYYSKIAEGPESALRHLVSELIEYVESEEYVDFTKGIEGH